MRIKVCSMTQMEQLQGLEDQQVEFAGFMFYPQSPRFLGGQIPAEDVRKFRGYINKVGVFVNPTYEEVMRAADAYGLHMVQLHGDETPKFCERISDQLETIKAFRIGPDENIEWKVRNYMTACDLFLFDTASGQYGGTGKKFDWRLLADVQVSKPFLLSGGISPEDADAIREFMGTEGGRNLFAVDINSKFEKHPGIKDMELIKPFVQAVKAL